MRTAFENEGDIRGVDLLACLVALWREGASGTLEFSRSGARAGFEVAAGELVGSTTSDPRFETAAILVRAGKLDTRTLERLAAPEGADRALLALQAGVLTRREHRWGEKIRAVEILSDLLGWLEGDYVFTRTTEAPRETAEPRLPIPRLILELFLRSRDRSLVLKYLGGADVPLARATNFDAEFSTFGLTADAESVVRLIDGTSSAEEIAAEAPAEAFAIEKLLAALVTLGLVHPAFAASAPETTARIESAPEPEIADEPEPPAAAAGGGVDEEEAAGEEDEPDVEEPSHVPSAELLNLRDPRIDDGSAPSDAEVPAEESEGPSELGDEEAEAEREEPAVDAPLSGRAVAPDLEFAPLGDQPGPVEEPVEIVDAAAPVEEFERPLEASTGLGDPERPAARSSSPLIWILVLLAVVVGGILWMRGRNPSGEASTTAALATTPRERPAATARAMETTAVAPPPGVEAATAVPAAAPTAAPAAKAPASAPTRSRPTPAPTRARPTAAPASPAPAAAANMNSRPYWLDRAARDAQKLASDKRIRYAIQLELACEVGSLVDAFQHDRAGSMWVLATPFQGKTCFKVLWGRYPSIEAARRAIPGSPKFFSTATNHPAVTGVR